MERLEKEWIEYPVLHFDMSTAKHVGKDELISELERKLTICERIYGRNEEAKIRQSQSISLAYFLNRVSKCEIFPSLMDKMEP